MRASVVLSCVAAWIVVLCPARPCEAQTEFEWVRGWYTDGTNDWYVVEEDDRVLMSTATRQDDNKVVGVVFELDVSSSAPAKSRPYGTNRSWTEFDLTFDGTGAFLIDGTPFTRLPDAFEVTDFDVRREDTPPGQYGLFFLIDQLRLHGDSLPDP